jgi:hypothetical protein
MESSTPSFTQPVFTGLQPFPLINLTRSAQLQHTHANLNRPVFNLNNAARLHLSLASTQDLATQDTLKTSEQLQSDCLASPHLLEMATSLDQPSRSTDRLRLTILPTNCAQARNDTMDVQPLQLQALPNELLHNIFERLDLEDVLAMRQTCKIMSRVGVDHFGSEVPLVPRRDKFRARDCKAPVVSFPHEIALLRYRPPDSPRL